MELVLASRHSYACLYPQIALRCEPILGVPPQEFTSCILGRQKGEKKWGHLLCERERDLPCVLGLHTKNEERIGYKREGVTHLEGWETGVLNKRVTESRRSLREKERGLGGRGRA